MGLRWTCESRPPFAAPLSIRCRTRRVSNEQLAAIKALTASADLPPIIDLAVETAMRLSEIVSLTSAQINSVQRTAFLPDTKNGSRRIVPLSPRAVDILHTMRGSIPDEHSRVFRLTPHAVTTAFRRATSRLCRESNGRFGWNLRFHDLRHEAVSRLFERGLNVIEVASISGHRSVQMLARYTHYDTHRLLDRLYPNPPIACNR